MCLGCRVEEFEGPGVEVEGCLARIVEHEVMRELRRPKYSKFGVGRILSYHYRGTIYKRIPLPFVPTLHLLLSSGLCGLGVEDADPC